MILDKIRSAGIHLIRILSISIPLVFFACSTTTDTAPGDTGPDTASVDGCQIETCSDTLNGEPDTSPDTEKHVRPMGPEAEVLSIAGNAGDTLWVGSRGGLAHLDLHSGDTQWYTVDETELRAPDVVAVAEASQDAIWVAYGTATCADEASLRCGVSQFNPSTSTWSHHTETSSEMLDDRITSLYWHSLGYLIAGSHLGLLFYTNENWSAYFDWTQCLYPAEHCEKLWSATVADITEGQYTDIWIAVDTQSIGISPKPGGVAQRTASTLTNTWNMNDGLPSNQARAIVNTDNGVWIGSGTGIAHLSPGTLQWDIESTIPTQAVEATLNGQLWAATSNGILTRDSAGDWSPWEFSADLHPGISVLHSMESVICFGGTSWVDCYDTANGEWLYRPAPLP